ncbi:MAG: hypothetical protein HY691_04840 [Chloroflexi bacterium]|nr:hypothetical protein [Chloroflexota bacterium]
MAHERAAILEHTSEVGVCGCAPALPAELAQAGLGLVSVITDLDAVGEARGPGGSPDGAKPPLETHLGVG